MFQAAPEEADFASASRQHYEMTLFRIYSHFPETSAVIDLLHSVFRLIPPIAILVLANMPANSRRSDDPSPTATSVDVRV